jgi:hypothetical protein
MKRAEMTAEKRGKKFSYRGQPTNITKEFSPFGGCPLIIPDENESGILKFRSMKLYRVEIPAEQIRYRISNE